MGLRGREAVFMRVKKSATRVSITAAAAATDTRAAGSAFTAGVDMFGKSRFKRIDFESHFCTRQRAFFPGLNRDDQGAARGHSDQRGTRACAQKENWTYHIRTGTVERHASNEGDKIE